MNAQRSSCQFQQNLLDGKNIHRNEMIKISEQLNDSCNHLPITFQMSSVVEGSGDLACQVTFLESLTNIHSKTLLMWPSIILLKSKSRVAQKERQQSGLQNVVYISLCCECTTNDYQRRPSIEENGNTVHIALLWVFVVCDSRGTIPRSRRFQWQSGHSRKRYSSLKAIHAFPAIADPN